MQKRLIAIMALAAALELPAARQNETMRARISGGGGGDGKCTFEVEVDGEAEVEIRGDEGYLRSLSGSPARSRRLECTQALPGDPSDFEFKKMDGRGYQKLDRDPNSNCGVAVIRIDDPKGGSERYRGKIKWRA